MRSLGRGRGSVSVPPKEAFVLMIALARPTRWGARPSDLATALFDEELPVPGEGVRQGGSGSRCRLRREWAGCRDGRGATDGACRRRVGCGPPLGPATLTLQAREDGMPASVSPNCTTRRQRETPQPNAAYQAYGWIPGLTVPRIDCRAEPWTSRITPPAGRAKSLSLPPAATVVCVASARL